ncbi:MAG: DNA replication/repair protein RecF [Bacillota bacterium]
MILNSISVENYRNYENQKVNLNSDVNIFFGDNGQGKTNLLEAVYYIATGSSFRNSKDLEIIKWDKDFFRIIGKIYKKSIEREIIIEFFYQNSGNKQLKINGVKYKKVSDVLGYLQAVIFSPDDLNIIKGSPAERRKFIDTEISQLTSGYYEVLANYNKVLNQRNNLLKVIRDNNEKTDTLEIWDEQLVKLGSIIIKNRIDFLKKVVPLARKIQYEITEGNEQLDITYNSIIIDKPENEIKVIEKSFHEIIKKNRNKEIYRAISLYGPHRDDLNFYVNKKDLKNYGSQGQQRTSILSVKIAELKMFYNHNDEYPLLLLDDVMSELDDKRRNFLIRVIRENQIQTLITGASKEITDNIIEKEIFKVVDGIITSC